MYCPGDKKRKKRTVNKKELSSLCVSRAKQGVTLHSRGYALEPMCEKVRIKPRALKLVAFFIKMQILHFDLFLTSRAFYSLQIVQVVQVRPSFMLSDSCWLAFLPRPIEQTAERKQSRSQKRDWGWGMPLKLEQVRQSDFFWCFLLLRPRARGTSLRLLWTVIVATHSVRVRGK